MLLRALILKTSALKPVERAVRRSKLFRPLVSRFIAGDTLDEALQASLALLEKGFFVTLDCLGENTKTEDEALAAGVPVIHFGTGASGYFRELHAAGGDVMGVDWRLNIDQAWMDISYRSAIQGNLDPARAGMAQAVGEGLLHHPETRHLHRRRQTRLAQVLAEGDVDEGILAQ